MCYLNLFRSVVSVMSVMCAVGGREVEDNDLTETMIVRTNAIGMLRADLSSLTRNVNAAVGGFNDAIHDITVEFERDSAIIVDSEKTMRDKVDRAELALQLLAVAAENAVARRVSSSYRTLWFISGCLWSLVAATAILQICVGRKIDVAHARAMKRSSMSMNVSDRRPWGKASSV